MLSGSGQAGLRENPSWVSVLRKNPYAVLIGVIMNPLKRTGLKTCTLIIELLNSYKYIKIELYFFF
jgi:hypothetical protein